MMGAWCWPPSMQGLTAGWAQEARIRIIWGLSRCNELAAGPKWMLARPALPSALLLTIWGMHGVQANVHEWGIPGQGRLHPQASHPPVCSGYQIRAVKSRTIRIPSLTWWRMFTGPESTFISPWLKFIVLESCTTLSVSVCHPSQDIGDCSLSWCNRCWVNTISHDNARQSVR